MRDAKYTLNSMCADRGEQGWYLIYHYSATIINWKKKTHSHFVVIN